MTFYRHPIALQQMYRFLIFSGGHSATFLSFGVEVATPAHEDVSSKGVKQSLDSMPTL